jgi:hypothetical protein
MLCNGWRNSPDSAGAKRDYRHHWLDRGRN